MMHSRNLNNPTIEWPFFVEMVNTLQGIQKKDNFNGYKYFIVECPE